MAAGCTTTTACRGPSKPGMSKLSSLGLRGSNKDTPAVDEAERKVAGVLHDLEQHTEGEVKAIDLEDLVERGAGSLCALVDTDHAGQPVVKKAVDITLQRNSKKDWAR